jgi:ureidoglycolate lyase
LTAEHFRPYGWLLGKGISPDSSLPAFKSSEIEFCQEHLFDPGPQGEIEVLWVIYRNRSRQVPSLEVHRLTQQAIVPLTAEIIHVVASSNEDGSPDMDSIRAFRIGVGQGICMRPGCWHTTRVEAHEGKCMMLTRRSTTIDLVAHLVGASRLSESAIFTLPECVRI